MHFTIDYNMLDGLVLQAVLVALSSIAVAVGVLCYFLGLIKTDANALVGQGDRTPVRRFSLWLILGIVPVVTTVAVCYMIIVL